MDGEGNKTYRLYKKCIELYKFHRRMRIVFMWGDAQSKTLTKALACPRGGCKVYQANGDVCNGNPCLIGKGRSTHEDWKKEERDRALDSHILLRAF